MKRIIMTLLSLVLLCTTMLSLSSCNSLFSGLLGGEALGDEWNEYGTHYKRSVSFSKPYVRQEDMNSGDGYCDECYIDISGPQTPDTGDAEGHYIYNGVAHILTITIDGKDYTHRATFSSDGSCRNYSACIKLKDDVPVSKITSGYIRVSGYEGHYKKVPHTYEAVGEVEPATCTKGSYQQYQCTDCGGWKDEFLSEATGHTLGEDGICTVCNHDTNPKPSDTSNGSSGGTEFISATYNPKLSLDIAPSGIGTRTGTIIVRVNTDPALISGRGAQSTKEDIVQINGVPQWDGSNLVVSYTVMGYGEADILVDLFSNELNDEFRAEIHVTIVDD